MKLKHVIKILTTMSTFVLNISTFGLVFKMVLANGKQFCRKISITGYMVFFPPEVFLFILWTSFFNLSAKRVPLVKKRVILIIET